MGRRQAASEGAEGGSCGKGDVGRAGGCERGVGAAPSGMGRDLGTGGSGTGSRASSAAPLHALCHACCTAPLPPFTRCLILPPSPCAEPAALPGPAQADVEAVALPAGTCRRRLAGEVGSRAYAAPARAAWRSWEGARATWCTMREAACRGGAALLSRHSPDPNRASDPRVWRVPGPPRTGRLALTPAPTGGAGHAHAALRERAGH